MSRVRFPSPAPSSLLRFRWIAGLLNRIPAIILTREAPYDRAQPRFVDLFRRLRGREPLDDPLLFFGPLFALPPDLQQKHAHVTDDDSSILQAFFIGERTDWALGNGAENAGLLESSRAAEYCGDLPFFGQPFGMTQRWVSRDVMSMNCGRREPVRNRYGKAPY